MCTSLWTNQRTNQLERLLCVSNKINSHRYIYAMSNRSDEIVYTVIESTIALYPLHYGKIIPKSTGL